MNCDAFIEDKEKKLKFRKVKSAYTIDIGKKRKKNDDAVLVNDRLRFYAVSDGMGGLEYGQKAARIVCAAMDDQVIPKVYKQYHISRDVKKAAQTLQKGLYTVSKAMYEDKNADGVTSFGATFCGVMILEDYLLWINMGDSRGYQYTASTSECRKVTKDHNLARIEVEEGRLDEEEAKQSGMSSKLYRFVGMKPNKIMPDVFITKAHKNDVLLLCSDGLYGMMKEKEIRHILKNTFSVKRMCKRFTKKANRNGGRDNISAVTIRFS